jgi:hypothetical protein
LEKRFPRDRVRKKIERRAGFVTGKISSGTQTARPREQHLVVSATTRK